MRRRVLCVFTLACLGACTEAGLRAAQLTLGGVPQRVAGTGDLSEPRFAGSSGSFLAVTDGGQPRMVFVVNAVTLETEPVSFRPTEPGVPAVGEIVRDMRVVPDDDSSGGSVSATAHRAAFLSQASNLLEPGAGVLFYRDSTQAFVKDIAAGTNHLVSAGVDGQPADHDVTSARLSSSGRFVVFATRATNLYAPANPSQAPNGASQVYVRDLATGDLQLISMAPTGVPGAGDSTDPVITADGRFVAFLSGAANLVTGDTNLAADVFVYDRLKMTMELVSISTGGAQSFVAPAEPAMTENGNFVAFAAMHVSGGPRQIWLRDRAAATTTLVSAGALGPGDDDSASPSLSGAGPFVAFASLATNLGGFADPLGVSDVFLFDNATATLTQVSLDTGGTMNGDGDSTEPTLSPDGTFLAYISRATNVAMDDPRRENGDSNGLANLIVTPLP